MVKDNKIFGLQYYVDCTVEIHYCGKMTLHLQIVYIQNWYR